MTKFNDEFSKIREIAFMIGTQDDGYNDFVFAFEKEEVRQKFENFMFYRNDEKVLSKSKTEFLNGLKNVRVEDWDDSYVVFKVIGGYSWELNIFYKNEEKPFIKKGANNYPDNFNDLLEVLEIKGFDI